MPDEMVNSQLYTYYTIIGIIPTKEGLTENVEDPAFTHYIVSKFRR